MAQLPDPIKGAPDWLPPASAAFDAVEHAFLETARLAGYQRVRTPVFEHTEVFARAVGESTDVVQKEMYTFDDRGGRSVTLRPEGTAGVVRAALNAGVPRSHRLPVKYVYAGENFRYERPQAGRQRQFNQVGVEVLGSDDPVLDAEVVILGWEALRRAGIPAEALTLRFNSLGDPEDRPAYHQELNAYLDTVDSALPDDVRERRHLNPLRAFDSKAPGMDQTMASAPVLGDHISDAAREHHGAVTELLEAEGVPITHDPRLVRGLDYYTRTTFEYQVEGLGAQNAVGGGGRYDGLAEELGWPERLPGIGWALGVDRTLLSLERAGLARTDQPRVVAFVIAATATLAPEALHLLQQLRGAGIVADMGWDGRSMKQQFKSADASGAAHAVILGEREAAAGVITVKDLTTGEQVEVGEDKLVAHLTG